MKKFEEGNYHVESFVAHRPPKEDEDRVVTLYRKIAEVCANERSRDVYAAMVNFMGCVISQQALGYKMDQEAAQDAVDITAANIKKTISHNWD